MNYAYLLSGLQNKMNVSIATNTNAESELGANQLLDRKNENRNGNCYVVDVHRNSREEAVARVPQF